MNGRPKLGLSRAAGVCPFHGSNSCSPVLRCIGDTSEGVGERGPRVDIVESFDKLRRALPVAIGVYTNAAHSPAPIGAGEQRALNRPGFVGGSNS